jgi:hypothetical protein
MKKKRATDTLKINGKKTRSRFQTKMSKCTSSFCTRRALVGNGLYCAVHAKLVKENKLEVFAEDIQGIPHYVDASLRVWKAEDIENQSAAPRQIGTAARASDGRLRILPREGATLETWGFALKSPTIIPAGNAEE